MRATRTDSAPAVTRRILLVSDEPDQAGALRETAAAAGPDYSLEHVASLAEALLDDTEGLACVLLDLSLGNTAALESLAQLRLAMPEVPIVVLSEAADEELALEAVENGAQDHLVKGRDRDLLPRSLHYAIERKRVEVALHQQSRHDPLTGLPTRTVFLDRLEAALARSLGRERSVGVLFLDLDRFEVINDSFGHAYGDQLLIQVADRLREVLTPGATLARFAADEFTIVCEGVDGVAAAVDLAQRIQDMFDKPHRLDGAEAHLTASIGIAVASDETALPETLIHDAVTAMHRAKDRGKSRFEVFEAVMRVGALERMRLENDLHRAIEREQLSVHYQPYVDLSTGLVLGVEALLRWEHPQLGATDPATFIGLAEETGLIVPLGRWILEQACSQTAAWHRDCEAAAGLAISVNLSGRQLQQGDVIDVVTGALTQSGMDAELLRLEITESVVVDEQESTLNVISALQELGVTLVIDDFGTGHASLGFLKRLPFGVLKIDQTFISGLGIDPADEPIVSAIVALARALGMRVIAEGVETADQLEALRKVGCELGQGYLFSRPLEADEIPALLGRDLRPSTGA